MSISGNGSPIVDLALPLQASIQLLRSVTLPRLKQSALDLAKRIASRGRPFIYSALPPLSASDGADNLKRMGERASIRAVGHWQTLLRRYRVFPMAARRVTEPLTVMFAAEDRAEALPSIAFESHHLKLLNREEVLSTGIDLDAWYQQVWCEILDAGSLSHHVLSRKVVTAHFENLVQSLCDAISVGGACVLFMCTRNILGEKFRESPHARVILPLWVASVLSVLSRQ
jgi:hypothetical protein